MIVTTGNKVTGVDVGKLQSCLIHNSQLSENISYLSYSHSLDDISCTMLQTPLEMFNLLSRLCLTSLVLRNTQ